MDILQNDKNIVIIIKHSEIIKNEMISPEPIVIDKTGRMYQPGPATKILTLKTGEKFYLSSNIILKVQNILNTLKTYL